MAAIAKFIAKTISNPEVIMLVIQHMTAIFMTSAVI